MFSIPCSVSHVQNSLPLNGTLLGIEMIPSSVEFNVANHSGQSYCNISVSYTHTGKNDSVLLNYALPDLHYFENRFYVASGAACNLSSVPTGVLLMGLPGAVQMLVTIPSVNHMMR